MYYMKNISDQHWGLGIGAKSGVNSDRKGSMKIVVIIWSRVYKVVCIQLMTGTGPLQTASRCTGNTPGTSKYKQVKKSYDFSDAIIQSPGMNLKNQNPKNQK